MLCTSSIMLTITGTPGAVVSTTITKLLVAGLLLPAASVAVTVSVCEPSLSGVPGVKLQTPPAPAVVVPNKVLPS